MANCGDTYVFFDPLGSSVSMLSSNNQLLVLNNGCQEGVSKGGLDRFVTPSRSSITLPFNTLGPNNKNQQLSRGSKCKPAKMFKNEGPMNPDFGEITQQLCTLINDNLEAMAKQLYDYWFVQFDFPNEEGKPYKSSGGAMVWNEKLKREIPQGVDAKKIGDIENNIITGKTPSCADKDNFGGDIPFVTIDDIRDNLFVFEAQRTLSIKGADSQEKKYLPIGSLSVSCIGTIGIMGFVVRLAQTNQQINSIVFEHEYNKEFLYFSLRLYFEKAKAKTGNVFANMSKEEFASIIVAYPPKQTLQAFHNKVAPMFDSMKNNIAEINTLTKQRDELLPLLMNDQASVNYHLSI